MSYKKLQDLLNAGSQGRRETPGLFSQSYRSPNSAQSQFSPLGQNLGSGASRSPSIPNIPGVQNMFYHPAPKNTVEPVCPSPMFQIPAKKAPQGFNSMFQGSRFTAAETNPTNNPTNFEANDISNSMNSLLNQLQPQYGNQPRNLEELLQKSVCSMPSNSCYQSPFNSSLQSPFMGGNNHHISQIQPSIGSELSHLLNPMTLLETSLQNPNLLNNQNAKNQSTESISKGLILQLAQILKQESESKIKSAIAELILKYRALGLLNNMSGGETLDLQSLIKGTEAAQHHPYQYPQNHQEMHQIHQQIPVSLAGGITMNPINRTELPQTAGSQMQMYAANLQSNKIDNARRELFVINEHQMSHQAQPQMQHQTQHQVQHQVQHQAQHQAPGPFQRALMQENVFQMNQPQNHIMSMRPSSISPSNNLDQEMDSLTLSNQMNLSQFTNLGITSTMSAPEKMEDLANADLGSILKNKVPSDEELPGVYDKYERINKILKYKNKIRKWRREHPVKRVFKGRSVVAGQKPRIKGKFVTIEEYTHHLGKDCKKEYEKFIKEEEEDF